MRMIPPYPLDTGSAGEKKVFDRLSMIMENSGFTAFHSLNLPRHKYKRFGEIDFLITGPPGIYVLEVKGGRVVCKEGIWSFTNLYGRTTQKPESPFHQASTALHGLMDKLGERFDKSFLSQFPIGYGVIFTECRPDVSGAEWERDVLMDAGDMNNLEEKLTALFSHWLKKHQSGKLPACQDLKVLNDWLRPEFESVFPLFDQIKSVRKRTSRFTRDQMVFADIIQANSRVICSGGAGTGKTFLAMELARQWTAQGKEVVMPCGSQWLKQYLESHFPMPGLTLTQVEYIELAGHRAGISQFDALIVDEGQDLFNMESLQAIDRCLKGGLSQGQWVFFHDVNNQSGLFKPVEPKAVQWLESCTPAKIPLTVNCRNTLNILDLVNERLRADMGVRGAGIGPVVKEQEVTSQEESAHYLEKEIYDLLDPGQLSLSQITILSPLPFRESSAALLPRELACQILELDPWAMRHFPPQLASFARIHEFKGLENEAVLVIDLPKPKKEPSSHHLNHTLLYIAMSRPRSLLSMIYHADQMDDAPGFESALS